MRVLVVDGLGPSRRSRRRAATSVGLIRKALGTLTLREATPTVVEVVRAGDLARDRWVCGDFTRHVGHDGRRPNIDGTKFDRLDLVFAEAEGALPPWAPEGAVLVNLAMMCVCARKPLLAAGSMGAFVAYASAVGDRRLCVHNGRGTGPDTFGAFPVPSYDANPDDDDGDDVLVDRFTGDYYHRRRGGGGEGALFFFEPVGSCGVRVVPGDHYEPAVGFLVGSVETERIGKGCRSRFSHLEKLGESRTVVRAPAVQHPLFRGVERAFVSYCASPWVLVEKTWTARSGNNRVFAEDAKGPQLATCADGVVLVLRAHLDPTYDAVPTLVANFVAMTYESILSHAQGRAGLPLRSFETLNNLQNLAAPPLSFDLVFPTATTTTSSSSSPSSSSAAVRRQEASSPKKTTTSRPNVVPSLLPLFTTSGLSTTTASQSARGRLESTSDAAALQAALRARMDKLVKVSAKLGVDHDLSATADRLVETLLKARVVVEEDVHDEPATTLGGELVEAPAPPWHDDGACCSSSEDEHESESTLGAAPESPAGDRPARSSTFAQPQRRLKAATTKKPRVVRGDPSSSLFSSSLSSPRRGQQPHSAAYDRHAEMARHLKAAPAYSVVRGDLYMTPEERSVERRRANKDRWVDPAKHNFNATFGGAPHHLPLRPAGGVRTEGGYMAHTIDPFRDTKLETGWRPVPDRKPADPVGRMNQPT